MKQMDNQKAAQTDALGTEPVGRLMLRLAAPSIAAQVIHLLYNMVSYLCNEEI